MTKYKQYFDKMLSENRALFSDFSKIHNLYSQDENKWQEQYNSEGLKILEIVNDYENKLCRQTEKGSFNVYSPQLSEKFRSEVKKHFPMIDHIGLKVEKDSPAADNAGSDFHLKKLL